MQRKRVTYVSHTATKRRNGDSTDDRGLEASRRVSHMMPLVCMEFVTNQLMNYDPTNHLRTDKAKAVKTNTPTSNRVELKKMFLLKVLISNGTRRIGYML